VIQECVVGTEEGHGFWPVGTRDWGGQDRGPECKRHDAKRVGNRHHKQAGRAGCAKESASVDFHGASVARVFGAGVAISK
jgi:hypothetical protein